MLAFRHQVAPCLPGGHRHGNQPDDAHCHRVHHRAEYVGRARAGDVAMIIQQVVRDARVVHQVVQQLANAALRPENVHACNDGAEQEHQEHHGVGQDYTL